MAARSRKGLGGATLVDTHAHLTDSAFDADRDAVLGRARSLGVTFVEVGFDENSSALAAEFAREQGLWCAVGIHPHYAISEDSCESRWKVIEDLIDSHRDCIRAVGEMGLDLRKSPVPQEDQMHCFALGLDIARAHELPVIIHQRDAGEEVLRVLSERHPGSPVIFHCFSGNPDYARRCLDAGGYLGFGGTLTFPRNDELRELLRFMPLNRVLLETDCPYLAPQAYRGKRNEPAYIREVAGTMAKVTGKSFDEVSCLTSENAARILGFSS